MGPKWIPACSQNNYMYQMAPTWQPVNVQNSYKMAPRWFPIIANRCLTDGSQNNYKMAPRCLPNGSRNNDQIAPKELPDGSKMAPRCCAAMIRFDPVWLDSIRLIRFEAHCGNSIRFTNFRFDSIVWIRSDSIRQFSIRLRTLVTHAA